MLVNEPEVLAKRQKRLSDVSWWARGTAEYVARRANRAVEATGRFKEGRFNFPGLEPE